VARAFAREGARVFLAGHTMAHLEEVAGQIRGAGGTAETAEVDALREDQVDAFGGSGEPPRDGYLGGLQVAFEAIESMRRQISSELGRQGVRFVTLRTGGVPETIPAGVEGREAIAASIEKSSMLGRAATLEDVGNVAAFVASDRARTMTAATANISCGALID
jgi:NAD(P)-dependent dehydrogenase (short-subunit alcohol dehydrogenase family)